jgi:hypothetical protein
MDYKEPLTTYTSFITSRYSRLTGAAVVIFVMLSLMIPSLALTSDWKDEVEDICSRTGVADSYSIEELQALIDRSNKLLKKIKASDNRRKKMFIMRLKKCRNFFAFTIDVKQGEKSQ